MPVSSQNKTKQNTSVSSEHRMKKLEFDQYDQLSATKNRKTRESRDLCNALSSLAPSFPSCDGFLKEV